ncbi:MAG TPA: type II toxin-antitoxin system VapC family toxin [Beijerinckiaceae bacterium]|jgi:ribonuclease VapC
MVVDASALVAIALEEPEADALSGRLNAAAIALTHPLSVYEAVLAVTRELKQPPYVTYRDLSDFMSAAGIEVVDIGSAETIAALEAFTRYGKGQKHPAQLNMGDCFSYACAKLRGMPLLYKGDDFARTDLA